MKREKTDSSEPRRPLPRRTTPRELAEEEQPEKLSSRSTLLTSPSQRVFELLEWLTWHLLDSKGKSVDEQKLCELRQLVGMVSENMPLHEMHNLDYTNRLHYVKKLMDRKPLKTKNWLALHSLIEEEATRAENMYFAHLTNFDYLLEMKARHSPC